MLRCLEPLTFGWTSSGEKSLAGITNSSTRGAGPANFNNDGLADTWRLSNHRVYAHFGDSRGIYSGSSGGTYIGRSGRRAILQGDINGDGRDDVLYVENDGDVWYRIYNGSSFGNSSGGASGRPSSNEPDGKYFLVDVNEDGFDDFVSFFSRRTDNVRGSWMRVRLSNGTGIASGYSEQAVPLATTSSSNQVTIDSNISFAEVNGDGLLDVVIYLRKNPDDIYVLPNEGEGSFGNVISLKLPDSPLESIDYNTFSGIPRYRSAANSVDLVDMNGDGISDAVIRAARAFYIYYGDGAGRFIENNNVLISDRYIESSIGWRNQDEMEFIDLNGDGLLDLWLYPKKQDNWHRYQVAYNLGDGFSGWNVNTNFVGDQDGDSSSYITDINGDGTSDVYFNNPDSNAARILRGKSQRPYIETFTDSNGNTHRVTYAKLTENDGDSDEHSEVYTRDKYTESAAVSDARSKNQRFYQSPLTVVKTLTTPTDQVYYKYAGARMHNGEHGYLGFKSITSVLAKKNDEGEDKSLITTSYLHQDYPFVGKLEAVKKEVVDGDAATVVNEVVYDYDNTPHLIAMHGGEPIGEQGYQRLAKGGATGTDFTGIVNSAFYWDSLDLTGGVVKPYLEEKIAKHIHLESQATLKTEITQSVWATAGNGSYARLYQSAQTVRDDDNRILQQQVTDWTYENEGNEGLADSFLVDTTSTTTTRYNDGRTSVRSIHTDTTEYDYHSNGLIQTQWFNRSQDQGLQTDYQYDNYGNAISTIVRPVNPTGDSDAPRQTSRSYTNQGKDLDSETNALGHVTSYRNFNVHGLPGLVTDSKGLSTGFSYDNLGRIASTTDYLGNVHRTERGLCSDNGTGCTNHAHSWERSIPAVGAESYTYFDRQGRKVKLAVQGFSGSDWNVQAWEYDQYGRVIKESVPRLQALSSELDLSESSVTDYHFTHYTYDELSRVVKTQLPGVNRVVIKDYSNGSRVHTIDPAGRSTYQKFNALGQLLAKRQSDDTVVRFIYDAQGNVTSQYFPAVDAQGARTGSSLRITNGYDHFGRQISMNDPSAGSWKYKYNAYGELIEQRDAKGSRTYFSYDGLGRVYTQRDRETYSLWHYDQSFPGLLDQVSQYNIAPIKHITDRDALTPSNIASRANLLYQQAHSYDLESKQLLSTTTQQRNRHGSLTSTTQSQTYDAYGRVATYTFPVSYYRHRGSLSAPTVAYDYNNRGYLQQVRNTSTGLVYQEVEQLDAFGNLTQQTLGGVNTLYRDFQTNTGWATRLQLDMSVEQSYENYNALGLMGRKVDSTVFLGGHTQRWTDRYEYNDSLGQQLTKVSSRYRQNYVNVLTYNWENSYDYDALGNLREQRLRFTDTSGTPGWEGEDFYNTSAVTKTYEYSDLSKPHRLSRVQGSLNRSYEYDRNGSVLSDGEKTMDYYSFHKVKNLRQGSNRTRYEYGPDRKRYLRVDTTATSVTETLYVGGSYERVSTSENGRTRVQHKFFVGDVAIITQSEGVPTKEETHYLVKDYQGSVIAITNENGHLVQRFRYDPFGEQRNVSMSLPGIIDPITTMGYTSHEEIPNFDIVQMGGRIYDPTIGRMLQADIVVQAPTKVLSYNRYAYVFNNPINLIDPTGYISVDGDGPEDHSDGSPSDGEEESLATQGSSEDDGNLNGDDDKLNEDDPTEDDYKEAIDKALKDKDDRALEQTIQALQDLLGGNDVRELVDSIKKKDYKKAAKATIKVLAGLTPWGKGYKAFRIAVKVYKKLSRRKPNAREIVNARDDLVTVRHHTSPDGLKGIKSDNAVNPGRGDPPGVQRL